MDDIVNELVSDLDASLDRFDEAPTIALQRRAMREALAHLYALHSHREETAKGVYLSMAEREDVGKVSLGVIYARGRLTHHITKEVGPENKGGVFDATVFDVSVFDCGTLTWLHDAEMVHPFSKEPDRGPKDLRNRGFYFKCVAGKPIRETLQVARDFLVESKRLPPL